ncbi:MAG: TonB-dependent receptor [Bacteroidia bacterium]|nr:TonB-dependent receptor [Bacteroidia bacterium]
MKPTTTSFTGRILLLFSFIPLIWGSMPEIQARTFLTDPVQQLVPLSKQIERVAITHKVSIIFDVDQTKNVFVQPISLGKSVDQDLNRLLRKVGFTYKKLNPQTYVIKKRGLKSKLKGSSALIVPEHLGEVITAKGFVFDADSRDPLVGATIIVEGSNKGVLSKEDGSFSIQIPRGNTLLIRYYGYLDTRIVAIAENMGSIYLQPSTQNLQEVVLVGYGTQKRSDLTGAVSSISEKELKELPVTGLDQAIQGRAAGVFVTQNSGAPGGGVSIRIRGIGSTLSAEPLYVIDGIPVVNDNQGSSSNFSELDGGGQNTSALTTINPNDIESIEILKDASATAIYGARAANGVVLIKTKRGTEGKSTLTFDSYYTSHQLARKIPLMNLKEYAEYYKDIAFDDIEEFENPDLLGEGTDWQDEVFRTAGMQNYQLTLAGGSKRTKYAFSTSYHFREGTVVGSDFTRISGKMNLDHSFNDRIRIGNSFLVSRTRENITFNDNSNGVIYTALLMVPNAAVKNADGSFAGPQEEISLSFDNPVARALETNDYNLKTRILSNIYLEADIFPFLKYRTEFGTDLNFSHHHTFYPTFQRGNLFGKSSLNKSWNQSYFWINKHLLTFDKEITPKHRLTFLGGFEIQEGKYDWIFATRQNLPSNDLQELTLGDAGQQNNDGGSGHWALLSYFGRLNYNFDDRYLLTATFRVDGSSRFGPNNRYGYFPSAAFAWKASNEKFMKKLMGDLNYDLKFRVGLGEVGNQEIGLYSFSSNLRSINVVLGDQLLTSFAPSNIANPDVRWESSRQANFGMNLSMFNNRIEVVVDYYNKVADGMLLPALLPATAGSLAPPFVNIGEVVNKGWEFSLNTVNTKGKFLWRTSANFSMNRNNVISLGSNGNLTGLLQRIPVTRTEEGQPIGMFYGHIVDGIFQSQSEIGESPFQTDGTRPGDIRFRDINSDGVIDEKDQSFLGSPHPDFTANLINNFSYKGFDLSIFLQSVYGNEILNLIRRDIEGMAGLVNQSVNVIDRYTNTNPSTTVPRATGPDPNDNRRISDRFIEDGSFLRLKNLTLGYTLPNTALQKLHVQYLRIYAGAQNYFTWTRYSGYDPDIGSFNQSPLINGVDNGRYPISKSITGGISLKF